jgi:hypothetical protein
MKVFLSVLILAGICVGPAAGTPDIRIEPLTLAFNPAAANPIYVEIDWMEDGTHSHRPSQAVIDRVVRTFARAGHTIHIDVSNAVPHQEAVDVKGSPGSSPEVQAIMAQHFDHSGDSRYHYSLWAHNFSLNGNFTTSSGIADLPGRVHLVTLGAFSGQVGTFSNQVGLFIHELGHNLNQRHGGADNGHYKPNYLSVMNYHYVLDGIGPVLLARGFANTASGFDDFSYSHGLMPDLDELSLDEGFGAGLGRAVDWNCDGTIETGVAKDIQDWHPCAAAAGLSTLSDFDNWTSLAPQIRTFGYVEQAVSRPEICPTWEENQPTHLEVERLRRLGLLPPEPEPSAVTEAGMNARSFVIHNDGDQPLTVTSLELDVATPWIDWEPKAPFTVPPGGLQTVHVYVDLPLAPGGTTGRRMLVQSNDADESPYPGGVNLSVTLPTQEALDFYSIVPCRAADTRTGPPLASGVTRTFPIAGSCGVPVSARAVALTLTAVNPAGNGNLVLWPANLAKPTASVINFTAGQTRTNNGILTLSTDGSGTLAAQGFVAGGGTVHLVLDVTGYFQ